MADYEVDKTGLDFNRRLLNLQRAEIDNAIPEYFNVDFPKLKALFEAYYKWMDSADNPGGQINRLYQSRDATQVPEGLLKYLEDELLLGQATFGGFVNKREAIKFSNQLYRSKGTKYSIQQFFRGFFGVDPEVQYPKENIFMVGPQIDYALDSINLAGQQIKRSASDIGAESLRYLTDDQKYQIMSVLVKSSVPAEEWLDAYKLFVHPAGAHIAAEIVLTLVNGNIIPSTRESGPGTPAVSTFQLEAISNINLLGYRAPTLIERGDGTIGMIRTDVDKTNQDLQTLFMDSLQSYTFREVLTPNSLTMDDSLDTRISSMDRDVVGEPPWAEFAVETIRLGIGYPPLNANLGAFLLSQHRTGRIMGDVTLTGNAKWGVDSQASGMGVADGLVFDKFSVDSNDPTIESNSMKWIKGVVRPAYNTWRVSETTLMPRFDEHVYQTLFDSSANLADSAHYPFQRV